MTSEYGRLSEGLKAYRDAMRPFLARRLRQAQPVGDWFELLVLQALTPVQADNLRRDLQREEGAGIIGKGKAGPEQLLDIHHFRRVISWSWERMFAGIFKDRRVLNWIEEVGQERNTWAHPPDGDLQPADVTRILDSCARVLEYVDKGVAARLKGLRDGRAEAAASGAPALTLALSQGEREVPTPPAGEPETGAGTPAPSQGEGMPSPPPYQGGARGGQGEALAGEPAAIAKAAPRGLKSWRDVVKPHLDVQQGRYQKAEFAADLQEVAKGKASAEYGDPGEFFRRTFVTADMHRLLAGVVRRLRGDGGDPVLDLKTAFGGGKTHTLLAVYHLVRSPEKLGANPDVQRIFAEAGGPPPEAQVAVLVGTYLDPVAPSRLQEETGGFQVNTMWGELAYQLGKLPGFKLVQEHDHHATAPGSDVLSRLFELAGPCVILIDELVAYLRNLPERPTKDYPGGTYGAHITFCQALTEAARRAPNVVVLASIPETKIEYGDARGERIASQVSNVFERVGAPWQPVSGHDAFEVVRRRLFGEIEDEAGRDAACEALGRMYREGTGDFPAETREPAYLERLRASYPVHPEIFERLYVDWAGNIDRFQRTRGVLRLMADAIHRLWASKDPDPMILPGSMPLYDSNVRQQLIGYLTDNWNGPFDADIDGDLCEAALAERSNQRFGHIQACRRLTRTIFLGSVPGKSHVGLESSRIMLGTVLPGEGVSVYGDALRTLSGRLSFLYGSEQRYWFEVRPNLNKVAADRIARVKDEEAGGEIRALLQQMKDTGDFAGVHRAPGAPADVADEPAARLVILGPEATHRKDDPESDAIREATRILDSRGTVPRQHRNMLAFLAADGEGVQAAMGEAKRYLGWRSIAQDGKAGTMSLDKGQQTQAEASRDDAGRTLEVRLHDAYRWLMVPEQVVQEEGPQPLSWQIYNLGGAGLGSIGSLVQRASYRMLTDGLLIRSWSPIHLKRELDQWVWQHGRTHVSLKQVWSYLTTYLYFSRLRSVEVLIEAVKTGVRSRDYFGYADGVEGDRYLGLVYGEPARLVLVDEASVLVRPDVAAQHVETKTPRAPGGGTAAVGPKPPGGEEPEPPKPRPVRRFFGTARLNPTRLGGSAGQIGEEVVQHLNGLLGAEVEVTIEIHARVPEGIPDDVVRTVSENARTLKFAQFEFDEE